MPDAVGNAEARIIKQLLDIAAAWADVPIKSSCFCRMGTAALRIG
jgi:hypothetical protein